jgi:hypothetical protein
MGTEIGDISRAVVYYYDDAELLNDMLYSQVTIDSSTYNTKAEHDLLVGVEKRFVIKSYNYKDEPKNYIPNKST